MAENLETQTADLPPMSDDMVQQMLVLAERLREEHGGELDDAVIQAVAEATSAPPEYVRLACRVIQERRKQSLVERVKNAFFTLEPDTRRHVVTSFLATSLASLQIAKIGTDDSTGLFGVLQILVIALGLWNVSLCRDSRIAAISGGIFGAVYVMAASFFGFITAVDYQAEPILLLPFTVMGALVGVAMQKIVDRNRGKLGLEDPVKERQELLRQLVSLQDRLRSGEQSVTFLSLDVVGSTQMKESSDPLSVEFTFTEYHNYVESVVRKYGGRIHSTAGDGVTCAFDHPQQAFAAAKNIQAGMIELNTHRNKIGVPMILRAGVHTGTVVAPGQDIKAVNFAHVIDISAHLQRVCPPGGVVVSEAAAKLLTGGPSAVGTECVEVMNTAGRIWTPRAALQAAVPADVPPPPTE